MASLTALFGMETLAPAKARALSIVYAASITLMMGVNFIQPALPALSQPFGITDAQLSWIMTLFTAPAIVLSPIFGVIADLYGRRLLLGLGLIAFGIFGAAMAPWRRRRRLQAAAPGLAVSTIAIRTTTLPTPRQEPVAELRPRSSTPSSGMAVFPLQ